MSTPMTTETQTVSGFQRRTFDPTKYRITCATWGREKEGKTHFAFTFPEPIYYLNLDRDNDDLLPKFPGKDIREARILAAPDLDPDSSRTSLLSFHKLYVEALADLKAEGHGTMVIDTFTVVRSLIDAIMHTEARQKRADAKGVGFDDVKNSQLDYQGANKRTRQYIQAVTLDAPGVNLVLLNKAKPIYGADGSPTGAYGPQVWGEVPGLVSLFAHQYKDGGKFITTLESCGPNPKLVGAPLPNLTYEVLRGMLLGE